MLFVGFNAETLEYNGIRFRVWDVGGQGEVPSCIGIILAFRMYVQYRLWHSDYFHFDLQL